MKKNQIIALGAIAIAAASCTGGAGVSTNVPLKSEGDTLAYAYGSAIAEQGIVQYLAQAGLVQDTAEVRFSYNYQIQAEQDQAKKQSLAKEMTAKIDSISKANTKNLSEFLAGVNEAFNAADSKNARMQGIQIGTQLKQMADGFSKTAFDGTDEKLNKEAVLAGLAATLKKEKAIVENPAMVVETKMRTIQENKTKAEFGDYIKENEKFLAENKSKEGVVTLPSGLQYKIVKEGTGAKPTPADRVTVHYHGTLIDGTVFDSSVDQGKPATFGVTQVIPGWTEALQLMPVGSKWILYIPADLGYGARATGNIKPYSTLIFEVELLSIDK